MADTTGFRAVIVFLEKLGVYDVVLPFLLVFTIVFAILEKTRVLGTDDVDGKHLPKKNLNAVVAFVMAFLVIASTSLFRIISEVLANVVLLMILVVSFLMLVGTFWGSKEAMLERNETWMKVFMILIFAAIVLILLQAMGWLELIIGIIYISPSTDWAATAVLLVIVIVFMYFITKDQSHGGHAEKGGDSGTHDKH